MSRRTKLFLITFAVLLLAGGMSYLVACWNSREPFQVRYLEQYIDPARGPETRTVVLEVKNASSTPIHCLHAICSTSAPLRRGNKRLPYMHYEYASGEEYPCIWTFTTLESLYNRYSTPHALGPIMPGETRRVEMCLDEVKVKRIPLGSLCVRYVDASSEGAVLERPGVDTNKRSRPENPVLISGGAWVHTHGELSGRDSSAPLEQLVKEARRWPRPGPGGVTNWSAVILGAPCRPKYSIPI